MCGIGGILIQKSNSKQDKYLNSLKEMSFKQKERGPDNEGFWYDKNEDVFLFHRRLTILDLTSQGNQPMISQNKRYIISYNGEIYNFLNLATEIKKFGTNFKSKSDTEVILESISCWGVYEAVKKFIGMFAIAVWDKKKSQLFLIRDRLGIKPLYWAFIDNTYLFASTIDSILSYSPQKREINNKALKTYLNFGYVLSPDSIFKNIYKVKPGSILKLEKNKEPVERTYWNLNLKVSENKNKTNYNYEDCKEKLEKLIQDSISLRMISDVPIGSFLSGGIDSSLVTSLMQKISSKPIQTFSLGFNDAGFNEANEAKKIAQYLKTDHHEFYVNDKILLDTIPEIHNIYDEPFFDSSAIPTFLLSKFTRKKVKVALSGDGGDELFVGYNRYLWGNRISKVNSYIPIRLRSFLHKIIKFVPQKTYEMLTSKLQKKFGMQAGGFKIYKLADCLTALDDDDLYQKLITHWNPKLLESLIKDYVNKNVKLCSIPRNISHIEERMQYADLTTYLCDDILTKVDRASMSNSLEVRVPLLDHRIVENSWRIPINFKIKNGEKKFILKDILNNYLPKELYERPKMGFAIPLDSWLRGQLFDWANSLIYETNWDYAFGFNNSFIIKSWDNFLKYGNPSATHIWILLSLSAWYKRF